MIDFFIITLCLQTLSENGIAKKVKNFQIVMVTLKFVLNNIAAHYMLLQIFDTFSRKCLPININDIPKPNNAYD